MYMQLKEIEPCNISNTSDADGLKFFRRLSGKESFNWNGSVKPKCMLLDCIIYKDNGGLNTVTGHLMSITVDKFTQMNELGISVQGIIEEYKVGWIQIDYRTQDNPPNVSIKAHEDLVYSKSGSSSNASGNPYKQLGNMQTQYLKPSNSGSSSKASSTSTSQSASSQSNNENQMAIPVPGANKKMLICALILVVIVGAILMFNSNSKKQAQQMATACVGKECNLRASPAKGKNVIRTIPKGGTVTIVEKTGEWVKVRYADSEGYIKSNLLK